MTRRSVLAAALGLFGIKRAPDDLTLNLVYQVLYDRAFFASTARGLRTGEPHENIAWVCERIAQDLDRWLAGELAPLVKEYARRAPWRRETIEEMLKR